MSQGVKNDHGDCNFKSEAARNRTRYHIVYWECANYMGIQFTPPSETTAKTRGGPGMCPACSNVVDAYKCRLDNMQTSLRMCVDSCGLAFREDIVDFVCLSPAMAIKYDLRRFQRYNTASDATHLTEETVIGTAMKVHRGVVDPARSGVTVTDFTKLPGYNAVMSQTGLLKPYIPWLSDYVSSIRKAAEASAGCSTGLMLDKHGIDVSSFGVSSPMFSHAPGLPICEVIILVGGPSGIDEVKTLPFILKVFNDTLGSGLHLGTIRVRLPGGLQHSYVALGDLLNFHDRGYLLPILEDFRHLGVTDYKLWYNRMGKTLGQLATSRHSLKHKKDILQGLISAFTALEETCPVTENKGDKANADDIDADRHLSQEVHSPSCSPSRSPPRNSTPTEHLSRRTLRRSDVEQRLEDLQSEGILPRREEREVRTKLIALDPDEALATIDLLTQLASRKLLKGPEMDLWRTLDALIDDVLGEYPDVDKIVDRQARLPPRDRSRSRSERRSHRGEGESSPTRTSQAQQTNDTPIFNVFGAAPRFPQAPRQPSEPPPISVIAANVPSVLSPRLDPRHPDGPPPSVPTEPEAINHSSTLSTTGKTGSATGVAGISETEERQKLIAERDELMAKLRRLRASPISDDVPDLWTRNSVPSPCEAVATSSERVEEPEAGTPQPSADLSSSPEAPAETGVPVASDGDHGLKSPHKTTRSSPVAKSTLDLRQLQRAHIPTNPFHKRPEVVPHSLQARKSGLSDSPKAASVPDTVAPPPLILTHNTGSLESPKESMPSTDLEAKATLESPCHWFQAEGVQSESRESTMSMTESTANTCGISSVPIPPPGPPPPHKLALAARPPMIASPPHEGAAVVVPPPQRRPGIQTIVCGELGEQSSQPSRPSMGQAWQSKKFKIDNSGGELGEKIGTIKSFSFKTDYGFIACPEVTAAGYGDVFLHADMRKGFQQGQTVKFDCILNKDGKPVAINLKSGSAEGAMFHGVWERSETSDSPSQGRQDEAVQSEVSETPMSVSATTRETCSGAPNVPRRVTVPYVREVPKSYLARKRNLLGMKQPASNTSSTEPSHTPEIRIRGSAALGSSGQHEPSMQLASPRSTASTIYSETNSPASSSAPSVAALPAEPVSIASDAASPVHVDQWYHSHRRNASEANPHDDSALEKASDADQLCKHWHSRPQQRLEHDVSNVKRSSPDEVCRDGHQHTTTQEATSETSRWQNYDDEYDVLSFDCQWGQVEAPDDMIAGATSNLAGPNGTAGVAQAKPVPRVVKPKAKPVAHPVVVEDENNARQPKPPFCDPAGFTKVEPAAHSVPVADENTERQPQTSVCDAAKLDRIAEIIPSYDAWDDELPDADPSPSLAEKVASMASSAESDVAAAPSLAEKVASMASSAEGDEVGSATENSDSWDRGLVDALFTTGQITYEAAEGLKRAPTDVIHVMVHRLAEIGHSDRDGRSAWILNELHNALGVPVHASVVEMLPHASCAVSSATAALGGEERCIPQNASPATSSTEHTPPQKRRNLPVPIRKKPVKSARQD